MYPHCMNCKFKEACERRQLPFVQYCIKWEPAEPSNITSNSRHRKEYKQ